MIKKYRPSNGTEGEWFQDKFCNNCLKDKEYRDNQTGGCEIICNTMCLDVDDPLYPSEWIETESGPTCTAFVDDNPENLAKKEWKERRDKNTIDMFGEKQ